MLDRATFAVIFLLLALVLFVSHDKLNGVSGHDNLEMLSTQEKLIELRHGQQQLIQDFQREERDLQRREQDLQRREQTLRMLSPESRAVASNRFWCPRWTKAGPQPVRYVPSKVNPIGWGDQFPNDFELSQRYSNSTKVDTPKARGTVAGLDVLLWHNMKCGGTSLRAALGKRCKAKQWTLRVVEAHTLTDEAHGILFGDQRALSVINLRHPLSRAASHLQMNLKKRKEDCAHGLTSRRDAFSVNRSLYCDLPMTLETELNVASCKGLPPGAKQKDLRAPRIETCVKEFYCTVLTGAEKGRERTITEADFEKAKARLANFDVILITEWMAEPQVAQYLNAVFEVDQSMIVPYLNRNHAASNKTVIQKSEDAQMVKENKFDLMLYEFACKLALERYHAKGFTSFMPAGIVTQKAHVHSAKYNATLSHAGEKKQMPCWDLGESSDGKAATRDS